jgi:uncharacterized OsmC-like protein
MNAEELKAAQAPIKQQYRDNPESALKVLTATGQIKPGLICHLDTEGGPVDAGLHPAAGGSGEWACSGDMLLQSLVACAGVTLSAVSTAMGISIDEANVTAEGDLDFRGTLGVSKETPIGFSAIRMKFDIKSDADDEKLATLLKLTERYCVIFQTLENPPTISVER